MTPGLRIDSDTQRHFGRYIILLIVAVLICVASYYAYIWYTKGDLPPVPVPAQAKADPSVDETPITPAQVDSYTVSATHPRYISIPALSVQKARVVEVGLTKYNVLDTPRNIADTAWYNKSALPGNGSGAVVIDGHNGGISKNGVFVNLGSLKRGDEIIVERGDGKKITYLVQENRTMSLQQANTTGMKDMMQPVDPSHEGLSLITCAGNWVPRDKVFDKRVMVRAVAQD